jgi:hypothetical protein
MPSTGGGSKGERLSWKRSAKRGRTRRQQIAGKVKAAGISARGLMDLVDVSPRVKTAPISAKLAELHADARHLRVFETTNSAALLILESGTAGRSEYAIERDDGLVADLKLFAQTDP